MLAFDMQPHRDEDFVRQIASNSMEEQGIISESPAARLKRVNQLFRGIEDESNGWMVMESALRLGKTLKTSKVQPKKDPTLEDAH